MWRPLCLVQIGSMLATAFTFRMTLSYGFQYFSISSATVVYMATLINLAILAASFGYVLIRYCKPAGDLSTEKKFLLIWSIVFIVNGLIAIAITIKSFYQMPTNRKLCPDGSTALKITILVVMFVIYLPMFFFKIWVIKRIGIHKGFCCFYASTIYTFIAFLYFLGISSSLWLEMTSPNCWYLRDGVELLYAFSLLIQGAVFMFLACKVIKPSE